ncbi:hypothetical protein DFH06DRAFT_644775 [Mycena polygramma]|nr:hypothetical protein DFH06DRAFT_644775 [Mycena polygramma]
MPPPNYTPDAPVAAVRDLREQFPTLPCARCLTQTCGSLYDTKSDSHEIFVEQHNTHPFSRLTLTRPSPSPCPLPRRCAAVAVLPCAAPSAFTYSAAPPGMRYRRLMLPCTSACLDLRTVRLPRIRRLVEPIRTGTYVWLGARPLRRGVLVCDVARKVFRHSELRTREWIPDYVIYDMLRSVPTPRCLPPHRSHRSSHPHTRRPTLVRTIPLTPLRTFISLLLAASLAYILPPI